MLSPKVHDRGGRLGGGRPLEEDRYTARAPWLARAQYAEAEQEDRTLPVETTSSATELSTTEMETPVSK